MEHNFYRSVTFTRPANTTLYTALDVVGATAAALNFASDSGIGAPFIIKSLDVQINQATAAATVFRLHLYSATPGSALADNAAFDLPAGDQPYYLGYADTASAVGLGVINFATSAVLNKGVRVAESASIFGYLQCITGFTPESAITGTVTIYCEGS